VPGVSTGHKVVIVQIAAVAAHYAEIETHFTPIRPDLVKALHRAGIEVVLDVVYNHTAEGKAEGPTLCFNGLANEIYYILNQDRAQYANYSGTGNTERQSASRSAYVY
jgi:pullulanase/glycogen debranching enzyme